MTEHGPERRAIREAMTRLLDGQPVRSDGKLTIKSLAEEAGINFTMQDIDRISRKVPCLCKVAPMTDKYHIEDVHRAGGICDHCLRCYRST